MKFIFICLLLTVSILAQESGKLSNGLEYYIMHNETPKGRASLCLVVKVGMMHEDEYQKGFAHLIEHSTWGGTKHLQDQDLLGTTKFPEHFCSMTGVDSTIFRMNIALAHPQAIDQALFLLKKIGSSASLLPETIDEERKEVLEEISAEIADPMRQKLNKQLEALGYPLDLFPQNLVHNTQFATAQDLQSFYHLHYRPDQMSLIAVGDFDEQIVKEKLEELFGSLANPPITPLLHEIQNSELPPHVSFLLLEHESFALPKVSISYLLPINLDKSIHPILIPPHRKPSSAPHPARNRSFHPTMPYCFISLSSTTRDRCRSIR